MVRHTLKIWQHLLQVFKIVSDHFTTLQSKGLNRGKSTENLLKVDYLKMATVVGGIHK